MVRQPKAQNECLQSSIASHTTFGIAGTDPYRLIIASKEICPIKNCKGTSS